jgi:hypothetical protein
MIALDHFVIKNMTILLIKRSRLADHMKTGQNLSDFRMVRYLDAPDQSKSTIQIPDWSGIRMVTAVT